MGNRAAERPPGLVWLQKGKEKGTREGKEEGKGKGCAVGQGSAVPACSHSGILQQYKR